MAKKKKETKKRAVINDAFIENAGLVLESSITDTLIDNYMPYAMSVIVSRAIPEIDGFKPSHRKLLYTMYKMGLLRSQTNVKSANVVGQTMKLNPHGDAAIYETMVRLARGNEALLHPYILSKGNFGKVYSRDMAYAASRYTEVRLEPICAEIFGGIEKDAVTFVDNYDSTLKEPTLLPTAYPSVLVNANMGIAVGMASSICPFNLSEICDTTIKYIRDSEHDIITTLPAPDFPGGGSIVFDENVIREIYNTGRGSIKVRANYSYDKTANCIEVLEIPYTTTIEAIIDKIVDGVKSNKLREISDIRDETDLQGLKIAIDLKRGVDPDKLMQKLYKMTPLEDSFGCNFNILIGQNPQVLGVKAILDNWIEFRAGCIKNATKHELDSLSKRLHLLKGLSKILLDIDKAIEIVRNTEEDSEVILNLMIAFGIDEVQANFVADIRLRQLNKEYILKRTDEIKELKNTIADLKDILAKEERVLDIIIADLTRIKEEYHIPRRSQVSAIQNIVFEEEEDDTPDYIVNIFVSKEGYIKKITPQSLRMSSEQKLKDGDYMAYTFPEVSSKSELLFFTDMGNCYKAICNEFEDTKASLMGDFIPAKLGFEPEEKLVFTALTSDFKGNLLFFFENGKAAKVTLKSYETKTRRKKLVNALSVASKLVFATTEVEPCDFLMMSVLNRALVVNSSKIAEKTTKNTAGVAVMTQKKNSFVVSVCALTDAKIENPHRYVTRNIPAVGAMLSFEDSAVRFEM